MLIIYSILTCVLLKFLYKPNLLVKLYQITVTAATIVDTKLLVKSEVKYNDEIFNIYIVNKNETTDKLSSKLLLWFHGGFFVTKEAVNQKFFVDFHTRQISGEIDGDIILFDYPDHFRYTQYDTFDYLHNVLTFVQSLKYAKIVIGGDSAGAFYAIWTIYKELGVIQFQQFPHTYDLPIVGALFFSGFFGYINGYMRQDDNALTSRSQILHLLFNFYFMRGITGKLQYQPRNLPVPNLIITGAGDFLLKHNRSFVKLNTKTTYLEIKESDAIHDFMLYGTSVKYPETFNKTKDFFVHL